MCKILLVNLLVKEPAIGMVMMYTNGKVYKNYVIIGTSYDQNIYGYLSNADHGVDHKTSIKEMPSKLKNWNINADGL